MNGLPYYKAYPRDFIEGTVGMTLEQKGAYRIVLDLIYMQGGELPDDARYISGALGCSVRKWKSLREWLISIGKIYVKGGVISNKTADKQLETTRKYQDKQAENRARPNKNKGLQSPNHHHTESEPDTESRDTPLTPQGGRCESDQPDHFEAWWNAYPHRGGAKKGKAMARKRWASALKSGADPADLIAAAERFHGDAQVLRGFAPDPATWLNQRRWEDDIEPDRPPEDPQRESYGEEAMRLLRQEREAAEQAGQDLLSMFPAPTNVIPIAAGGSR